MKTWLIHHMQALRLVLSRFQKNRLGTLLICLSIGVTLALPSVAYIILDNLNGLVSSVKSESQISVFLTEKHDTALVSGIEKILKQNPAIQNVIFVSKQDALEQLTAIDANKSLLDSLQGNPLPDAFFVEPKMLDATSIESLKNELSKIQGVETVLVDGVWIKRLNSLLFLGKKILIILAGLLGFALIAVIGNTIRMQVLTQSAEIELSRLIGATKSFIRRPFLYVGGLYGLGGGALALMITWVMILFFNQTIKAIANSYQSDFNLHFLSFAEILVVLIISTALGWISAYFSLSSSAKRT
ncbi:permease-like cell division protein FtsX [Methylotenera versatilis]|uniref:permease-like cell division protein FtsX n=1 Tax=Methylotenera versatilis TaxID=1055487 RepID=UPI000647119A|nr:permease-like cell division protein FtsX [Methylotenera versatilis]